jgi:hypothetical protein
MIRAAVRYADNEGSPPPELSKYLRWKTWGVLPRGPAGDAQRYGELERMLACANAYEIWRMHTREHKLDKMSKEQIEMLGFLTRLMNG